VKREGPPLAALLSEHKDSILAKWLESILKTHSDSAGNFLIRETDPFRNPVGHTVREGLSLVFDHLVGAEAVVAMETALDGIVRIRAVQDVSAGQALAFVFVLKRIIRAELSDKAGRFPDEFAALEFRIDEVALLAFDLFMKCREQIYEIRANESRRMAFLSERTHQKNIARSIEQERGE
jgi:hypothetical protein